MKKVISAAIQISYTEEVPTEEQEILARRLMEEVSELNVSEIRPAIEGTVPEGAKSIEAVTVGSMLITLMPLVLPKLIDTLQSWASSKRDRKISFKASVGGQTIELDLPYTEESRADVSTMAASLIESAANKTAPVS